MIEVEDMEGDVPVHNGWLRFVWDRDEDVARIAANLIRTLATDWGSATWWRSCQGQSSDNGGPHETFF